MAEIKDDQTERLVVLLPKALKRRIVAVSRMLEDADEPDPTITRIVREILADGIDRYEKRARVKIEK